MSMSTSSRLPLPLAIPLALILATAGCTAEDPTTPRDGGPTEDVAPDRGDVDAGPACTTPPPYTEDVSTCEPLATDYMPRVNNSADDAWKACISDDNVFHQIEPTVSSIARVAAFEDIAERLWNGDRLPSAQDFIDARVLYAQEQGLDSRVQRRQDIHYPPDAQGRACNEKGVPEANPDFCVGPAKLLPILNDAFAGGAKGEAPRVNAARIEAALLWFFYVSVLSEITSCAETPRDCDSQWAYYSGGTPRESPLGLGRYIDALGPETHDRAYDGVLAARCWRNLDNETGEAMNLELRDRARAQVDRAMIRGMALIVRQRLESLACSVGDRQAAHLAFLEVLVPLLDRESRARDAGLADELQAAFDDAAAAVDAGDSAALQSAVEDATRALDALYPCP